METPKKNRQGSTVGSPLSQMFSRESLKSPTVTTTVTMMSIDGDPKERSPPEPREESPSLNRSTDPERIVDHTRSVVALTGRLYTDCTTFVPFGVLNGQGKLDQGKLAEVSNYLLCRATSLKAEMRQKKRSSDSWMPRVAECQAFFVNTGSEITMVTVKHNFCHVTKMHEGELTRDKVILVDIVCARESLYLKFLQHQKLFWDADKLKRKKAFMFDKEKPDETWTYGREIQLIDLKKETEVMKMLNTGRIAAFDPISPFFKLEEGMEVGIMAHSPVGNIAKLIKNGTFGNRAVDHEDYQAQSGDTFVSVGKIMKVGRHHVEYDVNTVPGFSGGPVFLVRPGYSEHLKVIATHAGWSEHLGSNLGFLVAEKLAERSVCQQLCALL